MYVFFSEQKKIIRCIKLRKYNEYNTESEILPRFTKKIIRKGEKNGHTFRR